MPSRNELIVRARAVGFDASTLHNDSKLEQKVLYLEKNATTFAGTAGSQVLTTTGVFSNNETVTVGTQVYTMKTALTAATTAGEVLIGGSASVSLDNLKEAINGTGTPGTNYGSQTPVNSVVTAGTKTATTLQVDARDTAFNNASVPTTETCANASFGAATLASGVAGVLATPADNAAGVKNVNAGIAGDRNVAV